MCRGRGLADLRFGRQARQERSLTRACGVPCLRHVAPGQRLAKTPRKPIRSANLPILNLQRRGTMVGKPPRARAVPQLEQLESREVPTTSGATTEAFDGTAVGALPAGWSQWTTNGAPVFSVTASPSQ